MADYIGWMIAAVVLGMLAWPIMHIIPTPTQKRQIILRNAARSQRIQVQLRKPDLPTAMMGQYDDLLGCVAYFYPATDSKLKGTYTALRSHNDECQWFWVKHRPEGHWLNKLLPAYEALPEQILAVEQGQAGTALFWRERGDESNVDLRLQELQQLNRLIELG